MISTDIWRAAIPGSTIITCFGRPEDRPVPRIGKRLRVNAGVITNDTRNQNRLDRAIVPCSTAAARGRPASLPSRTAADIGAFVRAETARHLRGFHAANDRAGQGQTRSRMA
jgi:hypothetical protein